jgi:hypothetical protein
MNEYYVYALLDPRKPGEYIYGEYKFDYEPFYIGKGKGNRINAHFYPSSLNDKNRKSNKIKSILNKGLEVVKLKILNDIDEFEAFLIEDKLIKLIGRIDLNEGILTNQCDGGPGISNSELLSKRVKIDCFDLNNNFIRRYDSMTEASINLNLKLSNINSVVSGKVVTCGGFKFKYVDRDDLSRDKIDKSVRVDAYSKNGEFIETFSSIAYASRKLKVKANYIQRCCKMEIKYVYDKYYFEYTDRKLDFEYTDRKQKRTTKEVVYLNDYERIVFKSITECAIYTEYSESMITNICRGKNGNQIDFDVFYLNDRSFDKKRAEYKNKSKIIKVAKCDDDMNIIKKYNKIVDVSLDGFNASCVSRALKYNRKHNGFYWVRI